jgi:hypothetical protein
MVTPKIWDGFLWVELLFFAGRFALGLVSAARAAFFAVRGFGFVEPCTIFVRGRLALVEPYTFLGDFTGIGFVNRLVPF